MPFIRFYEIKLVRKYCGSFLMQNNFVMSAAHCYRSKINVTLDAHNIKKKENTQQVIPVLKAIPHKEYNNKTVVNDIMLLNVCSVTAWGKLADGKNPDTLQEVDLEIQNKQKYRDIFPFYSSPSSYGDSG
uniref:granzyme B-like n=1 Tax=Callospermophilus lateralis TaxID=76772 RepID=UPI004038E3E0